MGMILDEKQVEMLYAEVFSAVERLLEERSHIVVAVDGRCGSGKTWLASELVERFGGRVAHMDDYYLPLEKRCGGWEQNAGANIDFARFSSEVLLPACYIGSRGIIRYRPYSCREGGYLDTRVLPPARLTIIEGSYSQHPKLVQELECLHRKDKEGILQSGLKNQEKNSGRDDIQHGFRYDLKIFLTCPEEIQCMRLKQREGENFKNFEARWIPLEEQYFKEYRIRENSDLVVDTGKEWTGEEDDLEIDVKKVQE